MKGNERNVRPLGIGIGALCLLALIAQSWARPPYAENSPLPLGIPADVWAYFIPRSNPVTPEKVELGRQLFFDPRLSADGTISCATCHDPARAFTDGKPLAVGIGGRVGKRHTPSLLNAMFHAGQLWDGRASSLEAQALLPLTHPDEMGNTSLEDVVARLRGVPEYVRQFREVFGSNVTSEGIARALAAYERTLVAGNSAFDRFMAGETNALSEAARRGLALFRGKARCTACHPVNTAFPFFTDQLYHNTGVAVNNPAFLPLVERLRRRLDQPISPADLKALEEEPGGLSLGRFLVTGHPLDIGAFKTPSLRNVELTAPYFHDGSAATLADVIRFYLQGGRENPYRDWDLHPISLTESEQRDLIEFLKSLTSEDLRRRTPTPNQRDDPLGR